MVNKINLPDGFGLVQDIEEEINGVKIKIQASSDGGNYTRITINDTTDFFFFRDNGQYDGHSVQVDCIGSNEAFAESMS